jgi:hypothetical protein
LIEYVLRTQLKQQFGRFNVAHCQNDDNNHR